MKKVRISPRLQKFLKSPTREIRMPELNDMVATIIEEVGENAIVGKSEAQIRDKYVEVMRAKTGKEVDAGKAAGDFSNFDRLGKGRDPYLERLKKDKQKEMPPFPKNMQGPDKKSE